MWGTSATDVYAAENFSGVHHRGATGGWTLVYPGRLSDVFGLSPTNVYAVGADGMAHFDGQSWQSFATTTGSKVWASSDTDIYVLEATKVHHFDGTSWTDIDIGTTSNVRAIGGTGPGDVFILAAGNEVVHYDGARWTPVAIGVNVAEANFATIYVDGSQWILGGQVSLGFGPPGKVSRFLRTGPGGIGK
jgi:hypothetical protein